MALTSLFGLDAVIAPREQFIAKKKTAQRPRPQKNAPNLRPLPKAQKPEQKAVQRKNQNATTTPQEAPERGIIRLMPPKHQKRAYQEMAESAKKNRKAFSQVGTPKEAFKSLLAKGLFSSTKSHFPKPKHYIHERSPNGDALTIEDGSAWSIKESDQKTVQGWSPNAPITFTPNKLSLISKLMFGTLTHNYRVVNLQTKESAQASLALGPFTNNENTKRIRKVTSNGELTFNDGTVWKCDTSKASLPIFKAWRAGQYVITGVNNTWFGLGQDNIIINVSSDNWLTAQRVY